MKNLLQSLFSSDDFMPHGSCYLWNPSLIGLHVASDLLIALAYFSIPLTLLYFVRRRKDLEFSWMFLCFAVFIVACGTTHLIEVWSIWHPVYWLAGGVKAVTAFSSILTAILLVRLIPRALALPSPTALRKAHADLEKEAVERREAQHALHERNIELQNAAETKNRFLAGMSHELRTPLNGIIGFAEFMADGKPGPINPKQREYLGDILCSGRHLLQLINDILDLAKVEAGKMVLNPETFPLRKAVDEACAIAKPLAQKKHIHLQVDVATELGEITHDPQKFKQILFNLLSNAVKFTNEEGRIDIAASLAGPGRFKVAVRDTGIGLKAQDLPRLFREFEQIDSGAAGPNQGTGLGLALTRKIVEFEGGNIAVESEPGKGSTFTVTLPLALERKQP